MRDRFAKLIKSIQREIEEEKSVRRRSTLTLQTMTKSVTLSFRVQRSGNYYNLTKVGVATLHFNTDAPQIWCAQAGSRNDRQARGLTFYNYNVDGEGAVWVEAATGRIFDSDLADGASKDFTAKIYITATADFTITASQMDY